MIVVLCANPALDVTYTVPQLRHGHVHRPTATARRAGGKGTNVARVVTQLGGQVRLVAPLGGATGVAFAADLAGTGIELHTVPIPGETRSSVAIVDERDATVVNEAGPQLDAEHWQRVLTTLDDVVRDADVLVLSGSVPAGAGETAYADIVERFRSVRMVVDATGSLLRHAARARPDVLAPNLHEAREALGNHTLSAAEAATELVSSGSGAALVSDGAAGATLVAAGRCWQAAPPERVVGNPTGAGDALTAALAVGLAAGTDWPRLLTSAVATSAAAVAVAVAGAVDLPLRQRLLDAAVAEAVPA